MNQPIGVGIIGCGAVSVNHFKALAQLNSARLTAVCDIDGRRLAEAEAAYGVPGYRDYHDLLADERVDAVHIVTPHYLHAQMAIDALHAGKHVLCEKPMAIHASDAERMAQAARESGKTLTVCFQNRYNAASLKMRETLDSGALGRVTGGSAVVTWDRSEAYYKSAAWRGKWATEGGGVLINQAIHTFDLLRWLAGEEIVDVRCSMSAKRLDRAIEVEDTVDMLLTTASGARFVFYASNCSVGNTPVSMVIKCERGEMHLRGNVLTIKSPDGETTEDYTSGVAYGKDYWGSGHGFLIEDFYKRLQEGRPAFILPEDALKTTILTEKAYTNSWPQRRRDA